MTDTQAQTSLEHRDIDLGDVTLHTVLAGEGPLVVLLHGFPEFWYSWRYQIPALASAGFRVAAPDMRGYNLSSKPKGVRQYTMPVLAKDVARLIDALGESKATVVGHDWGANVAWIFAMQHPDKLERLAILNVPHPVVFQKGLKKWSQLKKSWYVFFFQLPWLPERFMLRGDVRSLRAMLHRDPIHKEAFSKEDVERYVEAFRQPGAATATINYYRAVFRMKKEESRGLIRPIQAPVLVIWGDQDRYLGVELAQPPTKLVPNVRVEHIPDASHWVQCDAAEKVNPLLVGFLRAPSSHGLGAVKQPHDRSANSDG